MLLKLRGKLSRTVHRRDYFSASYRPGVYMSTIAFIVDRTIRGHMHLWMHGHELGGGAMVKPYMAIHQ